MLPRGGEQPGG